MEFMIRYALTFIGKPYRWGGSSPMNGFDCSGLIQEILASVGMDPPGDQTAQALFDHFEKNGSLGVQKAGALAFYGKSVTQITHIAFMIDPYRVIEAGGGGSKTQTLQDAIDQGAYVRMRLLKHRSDLVATVMPRYAPIGLV